MNNLNLYRVNLVGLSSATHTDFNTNYVVAENPEAAYRKVRKLLDEEDYGFPKGRCLDSVELIAGDGRYPECRTKLFL